MKKIDAEIKALEVGLGFFEELKVVASPPHIVDSGASVMPKMNNEPVAWMDGEGGFYHNDDYEVCKEHNIADDLIPLYTHPADTIPYKDLHQMVKNVLAHPVKELTIEEIDEVSKEIFKGYKNFYHYQINFARAILRKAQE